MRIYNRTEFMKLPEGTLYCQGKPLYFNGLLVKGETIGDDWYCRNLMWITADSSDEAFKRLDEMIGNGASYPIEDAYGRDGGFDEEDIFMLYEKEDLIELAKVLLDANEALKMIAPKPLDLRDCKAQIDPEYKERHDE